MYPEYTGKFMVFPPLKPEHQAFLTKFSEHRRITWDAAKCANVPDPVREAVKLPLGDQGQFFLGCYPNDFWDGEDAHREELKGLLTNANLPPEGQPGLWCDWVPEPGGNLISWNGNEKFWNGGPWIKYLIDNFLAPWGYKVSGVVGVRTGHGPGHILVADNVVKER